MEKNPPGKQKKALTAALILAITAVAALVVMIIVSTRKTELLFRLISTGVFILLGWATMYLILNVAFESRLAIPFRLKALVAGKNLKKQNPGVIRRIGADILLYLLWAFLAAVLVSFIFNVAKAVPVKEKIVIYTSAPATDESALLDEIEDRYPAPIRKVELHPFSYAVFGTEIRKADLFILGESYMEDFGTEFTDLSAYRSLRPELSFYEQNGIPVGILIKGDPIMLLDGFIDYDEERYYLCFNAGSLHSSPPDGASFKLLELFLSDLPAFGQARE
ncbi:MAG: hypothetical protein IK088_00950 [Lachnospiraceae bacterium]|nr:hypothetical protein [Lachnospiraceae bacterium]